MATTVEQAKKTIDDILQNRIIEVKLIIREGATHFPKGHDGEGLFTDAIWSTDLAKNPQTNRYIQLFDREEQALLEKEIGLAEGDLSFNRSDKFWATFRIKLTKDGKKLNLADPYDYISYLVLKASKRIAPTWDERLSSGEYRFALVDENIVIQEASSKSRLKQSAYKYFSTIDESIEDMQMVIKLLSFKRTSSKNLDFLRAEVEKLIDLNLKAFVDLIEDKDYTYMVFIEKCIDKNIVTKNHKGEYLVKGEESPFAYDLKAAIDFLKNKKNQDIYLKLKTQIG
jgi:hypothetical protein